MLRELIRRAAAAVCAVWGLSFVIVVAGDSRADDGARLRVSGGDVMVAQEVIERHVIFGDDDADAELLQDIIIRYHAQEIWAGAKATAYGWSVYSGLNWAPIGNNGVQADGFRLRVASSVSWKGDPANVLQVAGVKSSTDVLAGYHKALGPLTAKLFAGVSLNGAALAELQSGNDDLGGEIGYLLALETWLNISPRLWLSTDTALTSAGHGFSLGSRFGYRVMPALSVGIEAAAYGNDTGEGGQLGSFLRLEWPSGELSVAGGLTGRNWDDRSRDKSGYGSVNWVYRY